MKCWCQMYLSVLWKWNSLCHCKILCKKIFGESYNKFILLFERKSFKTMNFVWKYKNSEQFGLYLEGRASSMLAFFYLTMHSTSLNCAIKSRACFKIIGGFSKFRSSIIFLLVSEVKGNVPNQNIKKDIGSMFVVEDNSIVDNMPFVLEARNDPQVQPWDVQKVKLLNVSKKWKVFFSIWHLQPLLWIPGITLIVVAFHNIPSMWSYQWILALPNVVLWNLCCTLSWLTMRVVAYHSNFNS